MSQLACTILLFCFSLPALPAFAQTQTQTQTQAETQIQANEPGALPSKFTLGETVLFYDTETSGGLDREIEAADVEELLGFLRGTEGLTTLSLNSAGGSVWAAKEMARIVIDFGLDTRVDGECSSSCVRVFLGGQGRSMTRGSKIGFHSRHWSPGSLQRYYEKWREDEGWDTPFEFASWVYRDTYAEAYEDMTWSIARGVAPDFAVDIHAPRDTMWFPTRATLQGAGLLRD